jgi:hypothetical protein
MEENGVALSVILVFHIDALLNLPVLLEIENTGSWVFVYVLRMSKLNIALLSQ